MPRANTGSNLADDGWRGSQLLHRKQKAALGPLSYSGFDIRYCINSRHETRLAAPDEATAVGVS